MFKRFLRAWPILALAFTTTAAAPAPQTTVAQRWSTPVDSRNASGPWLSVRRGTIYSVRNAHVIALDLATGRLRWTSPVLVESRPAIGGHTIYAPVRHGIVALDAVTGREIGRLPMAETPELITADFAAVAIVEGTTPDHRRLLGFRTGLAPVWQRELVGGWSRADDIGNDTLVLTDDHAASVLALDARNGNIVATTDGVDEYVGRDRETLWFSVSGGGLKSLDLATNRSVSIHNSIVRGAVRVEGHTAVAVVNGRLVGLSLPDGSETPLPITGRWVGGPADGTIFIARSDGMFAQRLGGGKPVRLVTNTSDERFLTSNGTTVFFATNFGTIVGIDLASLTPTTHLTTACRFVEGVRLIDRTTLVHCDDKASTSRLYGYTRSHHGASETPLFFESGGRDRSERR